MDRSRSLPRGLPFRLASDAILLLREYVTGLLSIPIYLHSYFVIRPSSDGAYYGMVISVRPSIHPSVRPSGSPSVSHNFPHFSPTCFDILSWNFACHFFLMNIRSTSSIVNFRQFLKELCPFWNLEYWKYTVFRSFLLHALPYWAEILHMTVLLYYSSSLSVVKFYQFV